MTVTENIIYKYTKKNRFNTKEAKPKVNQEVVVNITFATFPGETKEINFAKNSVTLQDVLDHTKTQKPKNALLYINGFATRALDTFIKDGDVVIQCYCICGA